LNACERGCREDRDNTRHKSMPNSRRDVGRARRATKPSPRRAMKPSNPRRAKKPSPKMPKGTPVAGKHAPTEPLSLVVRSPKV
jgi:hypothetical protein